MTAEPSLQKRSAYKMAANVVGSAVNVFAQALVPRALGPVAYGNFSYVTSFFWQLVGFLNSNSSTAFYTKLSQRPTDAGLVRFYGRFAAAVALGALVFCTAVVALGLSDRLWPGQERSIVFFGAVWAALMFLMMIVSDMADALGLTFYAELIKTVVKILGLVVIVILFQNRWLSLTSYFLSQAIFLALPLLALGHLLERRRGVFRQAWFATDVPSGPYAMEFKAFCVPLLSFTVFAVLEQMLDRWLLQRYSGSVGQGYYALSSQVGNLCFLFTSAVIPLVFRESAISVQNNDEERLRTLFKHSVSVLFSVSAFICCFCAVNASALTALFGGQGFAGASAALLMMCFFPIHQGVGQLSGNLFFALGLVRIYRNIGLVVLAVGVPLSLVLFGPRSVGALQWGALGLAIKMVVAQILSVEAQLFFLARRLNFSFHRLLAQQVGTVLTFLCLAGGASFGTQKCLVGAVPGARLAGSGLLYMAMVAVLMAIRPGLLSLDRADVVRAYQFLMAKTKGSRGAPPRSAA